MGLFVWHVVKDADLLRQRSCHGISSRRMQKATGCVSPPGRHWRVHAEESLSDGNEYERELLMSMVVQLTHPLGKTFPVSAIHGAESEQRGAGLHLLMDGNGGKCGCRNAACT